MNGLENFVLIIRNKQARQIQNLKKIIWTRFILWVLWSSKAISSREQRSFWTFCCSLFVGSGIVKLSQSTEESSILDFGLSLNELCDRCIFMDSFSYNGNFYNKHIDKMLVLYCIFLIEWINMYIKI